MARPLRWGVLSTATIAVTKVIPGLRRAERAEVVTIGSRDPAAAERCAAELGIPRAHGSYQDVLDDPEVEAVYIPLPNHLHAEWAIAALHAGKHVLCEKPLATTSADARRMVEAADTTGMVLMEAFMYRHHPSWLAARRYLREGRIGRLMAVQTWFSYYNDDPGNIRNIVDTGGGALYDIGCYGVNLSRMLFEGEPTRVRASMLQDPASGTDVVTAAILEFAEGIASFTCSTRAEDDQRVDIYGTTGRISIEIPFNIPPDRPTRITITAGGDPPVAPASEVVEFPAADPYAAEADAFAAAVLDGAPHPLPPTDAIANLEVIERICASASDGATPG
jgi:predicted dehydrogenase